METLTIDPYIKQKSDLLDIILFSKFHFCLPVIFKTCLISLKEVTINWDPTVHMAIHDRITEVIQDGQELKGWYMIQQYRQTPNSCCSPS